MSFNIRLMMPTGCGNMINKNRNLFIIFGLLPGFLLVLLVIVYPALKALYMSFFNATALSQHPSFAGLDNFLYLAKDDNFIISLKNTLLLMLVVPVVTLFISVVLAVMVTQVKFKEKALYRILFFFPSVLSLIVVGIVWSFIYNPNLGILNGFLEAIGLDSLAMMWLGDSRTALMAVGITLVWQAAGYYMIMYVAGIDRIPAELYESATLDGAGPIRKFTSVTFPFLWELMRITYIFAVNGVVSLSFVLTTVMTGGGPGLSTSVIFLYMYNQAFTNANFGYAMAIAVVAMVILFALAVVSNKLTERDNIEY